MPGPKTLSPDEAERVRAGMRRLLSDCDGNQSELKRRLVARGHHVSQQVISRITRATNPEAPGAYVARIVADMLGVSYDALVRGTTSEPPRATEPRLDAVPGWAEALAEARRKYPRADNMYDRIGLIRWAGPVGPLTPEWVSSLATLWSQVTQGVGDQTEKWRKR